ncbi:MAG: PDZ domain-containing protein, partial [Thermoguttaceae bacterium]|nr:PDZ domain-containing protein [Thermoguttaceae bacterium]
MSAPRLPQHIDPPKIPNSMRKGSERQEPPKSNFFFILMMTFLVIWTFRVFRSDNSEPIVANEGDAVVDVGSAPELSEEVLKTLPKDVLEAAENSQNRVNPNFVTLGSLDPDSSYRMLVTLSNRGASITRVELNESAYIDNSDSSGYLGQFVVDETLANEESRVGLPGVRAQAVGRGTPLDIAGIKVGDRIVSFADSKGTSTQIGGMLDLREALLKTKPGDKVKLGVYKAEILQANSAYQAAALTATKLYMNRASKPSEDPASSESQDSELPQAPIDATEESVPEVPADSNEDDELIATDATEKSKTNKDASVNQNQTGFVEELGAPTQVEVQLTRAPLSVLRPSGLVRDYDDYLDLIGLQGGYVDFGENENNYLRNYDKKAPHVRKVNSEPASFLTTLGSIDGEKIANWAPSESTNRRELNSDAARSPLLDAELAGVNLRNGFWEYVADESTDSVAVFRKILLERRLEVTKRYELVQVSESDKKDQSNTKSSDSQDIPLGNGRAYHLKLSFQVRNIDPNAERVVSCLTDGPTGLPLEGAWFSTGRKTGPKMGSYGLRDLVVSINNRKTFNVISCWNIAQGKNSQQSDEIKLDFLGVDGQYFQCTAIPDSTIADERFAYAPIRVGSRLVEHMNFT